MSILHLTSCVHLASFVIMPPSWNILQSLALCDLSLPVLGMVALRLNSYGVLQFLPKQNREKNSTISNANKNKLVQRVCNCLKIVKCLINAFKT
jgi:hypothetical protein